MSTPVQDGRASSALDADGLRIWSCVICRRRMVRYDRREPHANCVRNNVECHYPVTGRIPRRRALPAGHPRAASDKDSVLINRLRRLESIVTEMSAQVEEGTSEQGGSASLQIPLRSQSSPNISYQTLVSGAQATAPRSGSLAEIQPVSEAHDRTNASHMNSNESEEIFGQLVVAKGGVLQAVCVDLYEVHNIFNAVEDVEFSGDSADQALGLSESRDAQAVTGHGFVLGLQPRLSNAISTRPLPSQMLFLWQNYLDNVDPFIKILHTPTITKIIQELRGSIASTGAELEVLLQAISLASVVSVEGEDVSTNFGEPKPQLQTEFRLGTEAALARSEFLTTQSVSVVQALVIYLYVLPYVGEKQLARPLTGALVRIATTLGIHKDASHQPQRSFLESEIRRRLWWQICLIDVRSKDPHTPQLSVSEDMFDASTPANMDDKFLESVQRLATLSNIESNKDKTVETQLAIARSARNAIWSTYFCNTNNSKPFNCFIASMTSLFFAKVQVLIYNQALKKVMKESARHSAETVSRIQHQLFSRSVEIVEAASDMITRMIGKAGGGRYRATSLGAQWGLCWVSYLVSHGERSQNERGARQRTFSVF